MARVIDGTANTVPWNAFFQLNQISADEYRSLPPELHASKPTYKASLEIEVARQLSDDGGMQLAAAAKLVGNVGVANVVIDQKRQGVLDDIWAGIIRARNTWGSEPRGSWPVTEFGDSEYWSSAHVSGRFHECMATLSYWMAHDEHEHPDSDPARIFLVNVAAADRRLRKRAAALGIKIEGNEFV